MAQTKDEILNMNIFSLPYDENQKISLFWPALKYQFLDTKFKLYWICYKGISWLNDFRLDKNYYQCHEWLELTSLDLLSYTRVNDADYDIKYFFHKHFDLNDLKWDISCDAESKNSSWRLRSIVYIQFDDHLKKNI